MSTEPTPGYVSHPQESAKSDRFSTAVVVLLGVYALGAPHSIWVAQASSLLMFVLWAYRWLILKKVPSVRTVPGFYPLIGFYGLAFISALASYEPKLSLDGMRNVLFMGMFVVVARAVKGPVVAMTLMGMMLVSAQFNVLWTFGQEVRGIGFRITAISQDSPFQGRVQVGDVLFLADGKRIQAPRDVFFISQSENPKRLMVIEGRRIELGLTVEIPVEELRNFGKNGNPELGLTFEPARDFRARGFYDHYATYAEVLQILISVAVGLWLSSLGNPRIRLWVAVFIATMVAALWLTRTRAPLGGLFVSGMVMWLAARRAGMVSSRFSRLWLGAILLASLMAVGAAYSSRGISVSDQREGSLFWRLVVWQEGVELVKRHPVLGIGRGSDKRHAAEWGLYAAGDLPPGHFHSTFLQIAVWYGLPALFTYAFLLWSLFGGLWDGLNLHSPPETGPGPPQAGRGLIVGTIGALSGFTASSLVHFNLGDGEVAMTLWLVLGCAFACCHRKR